MDLGGRPTGLTSLGYGPADHKVNGLKAAVRKFCYILHSWKCRPMFSLLTIQNYHVPVIGNSLTVSPKQFYFKQRGFLLVFYKTCCRVQIAGVTKLKVQS